ncbi:MAG: DUF924 domain-containing protein [Alphaproteobacteria bacterium]|nr:DUF924 domain-containing protein [Alphaproteobacteria bacterium]
MADPRVDEVLRFWFEEIDRSAWFAKSDAFDAALTDRFSTLWAEAAGGGLMDWPVTADGRLALILVLDQFSRNLNRGRPEAFAHDPRARAIARQAIALGDHTRAAPEVGLFLFLPFEHSEDLVDQDWCAELFAALGNPDWVDYAERHRVVIKRFGRFPHRNEALGRDNTAEEQAFLQQPNSSF